MTTLYLIRHASADERGPSYPDDSKRPLVKKGFRQARELADLFGKLELDFDHMFSSPYTRAMQTAKPLERFLKSGTIQYLDSLTGSDHPALLKDIQAHAKKAKCLAAVGHEPYLSQFAAYLLAETQDVHITFKKSAFMCLSGRLEAGKMTLDMLVPYAVYKHIQ